MDAITVLFVGGLLLFVALIWALMNMADDKPSGLSDADWDRIANHPPHSPNFRRVK